MSPWWILSALVTAGLALGLIVKIRAPKIQDPVFGKLQGSWAGWEGRTFFPQVGHEVEVFIAASDRKPPNEAHYAMWQDLWQVFPERWPSWLESVRRELLESQIQLGDIHEARLVSVTSPGYDEDDWELTLELAGDGYLYWGFLWLHSRDLTLTEVDCGYADETGRRESERRLRAEYDIRP